VQTEGEKAMTRMTGIIMAALLLSACNQTMLVPGPADGIDIPECPGAQGPDIKIWYGDSHIKVTNRVSAKSDGKVVIKMFPDNTSDNGVNYETLNISLIGKDAKSSWLTRTMNSTESASKKATICVGGQDAGTYEYLVVVPGVGSIDPRVDINN
jgi:hypothetical protein